ncbi:MAG: hypothetical protein GXP62_08560, partial [Oligoflexia bacterium]|nr:hypothetical protein [Oligoflexia bacterium]
AASQLRLGRRSGSDETCSETVALAELTDLETPPSDMVLTWWELSWDSTDLACFLEGEGAGDQPFRLGVGLMHPEMVAVLDVVDEVSTTAAAGSLNAAYLQLNGDDRLLVYGVAGPAAAYAGYGKPADQAPLADGTWLIRGAYSLPLTW